jgi:hypothetical protein
METRKAISVEPLANQKKPKPYQSPLWAHLDEIHKWRMAQQTWEAISDKLCAQYGIKVSLQCVQAFFQRAARRGFRRPLGFERERSGSIAVETVVTVAQGPESIYEEARKALRIERQSRPKIIRADRPL